MKNPWAAWLNAATFAAEAQWVIGLRMMRLAAGGAAATSEAQRMIVEKAVAAARAAAKPYRRAVRANRRRLTRKR